MATLQVKSTLGILMVCAETGNVISCIDKTHIARCDLAEYCSRTNTPQESISDTILDINELGYWYDTGTYEPFDQGFFDMVRGRQPV